MLPSRASRSRALIFPIGGISRRGFEGKLIVGQFTDVPRSAADGVITGNEVPPLGLPATIPSITPLSFPTYTKPGGRARGRAGREAGRRCWCGSPATPSPTARTDPARGGGCGSAGAPRSAAWRPPAPSARRRQCRGDTWRRRRSSRSSGSTFRRHRRRGRARAARAAPDSRCCRRRPLPRCEPWRCRRGGARARLRISSRALAADVAAKQAACGLLARALDAPCLSAEIIRLTAGRIVGEARGCHTNEFLRFDRYARPAPSAGFCFLGYRAPEVDDSRSACRHRRRCAARSRQCGGKSGGPCWRNGKSCQFSRESAPARARLNKLGEGLPAEAGNPSRLPGGRPGLFPSAEDDQDRLARAETPLLVAA